MSEQFSDSSVTPEAEQAARSEWARMCGDPAQEPSLDWIQGYGGGYEAGAAEAEKELREAVRLLRGSLFALDRGASANFVTGVEEFLARHHEGQKPHIEEEAGK